MLASRFVLIFLAVIGALHCAAAAGKEPAPLQRFEQEGKFGFKDATAMW